MNAGNIKSGKNSDIRNNANYLAKMEVKYMKRRKIVFVIEVFVMLITATIITTGCESTDAIAVLQGISDGLEAYQEDLENGVYF